jgi:hypothetical protein
MLWYTLFAPNAVLTWYDVIFVHETFKFSAAVSLYFVTDNNSNHTCPTRRTGTSACTWMKVARGRRPNCSVLELLSCVGLTDSLSELDRRSEGLRTRLVIRRAKSRWQEIKKLLGQVYASSFPCARLALNPGCFRCDVYSTCFAAPS